MTAEPRQIFQPKREFSAVCLTDTPRTQALKREFRELSVRHAALLQQTPRDHEAIAQITARKLVIATEVFNE